MKKTKINTRKLRYGAATIIFSLVMVAILVFVNGFAALLTDRFSLKLDLTETGQYTLSDQTKDVLSTMENPVHIYILATEASMNKNEQAIVALETIQRYNSESGGKVTFEFVDPNKNPQFFRDYPEANNAESRAFVVKGPERYKVVESQYFAYTLGQSTDVYYQSEEMLTAAMQYVSSPEVASAGFVTGHNETELPALEKIFKGNYFDVSEVSLLKGIPEEINNLVISAPLADFTEEEIRALDDYLKKPDNNVFLFWGFAVPKLPNLESYLEEWGVAFPSYIVLDDTNAYQNQAGIIPAFTTEGKELIADNQGQLRIISPTTRPIEVLFGESGYRRVVPVLKSQNTSYAKLISEELYTSDFSRSEGDAMGPFTIMAVSEHAVDPNNGGISRIMVFGTDAFAREDVIGLSVGYNNNFVTDSVSYANPETSTITIKPKVVSFHDLNITEAEGNRLFIILVIVIPALIFALGIVIFVRRIRK